MQRIDNVGQQTFIKKEFQKIVAIVSGGFKPYFYFG